jgi:hypothetical protein
LPDEWHGHVEAAARIGGELFLFHESEFVRVTLGADLQGLVTRAHRRAPGARRRRVSPRVSTAGC